MEKKKWLNIGKKNKGSLRKSTDWILWLQFTKLDLHDRCCKSLEPSSNWNNKIWISYYGKKAHKNLFINATNLDDGEKNLLHFP